MMREPCPERSAPWMDEDNGAQLGGHFPERPEKGISDVFVLDQRRDLHAFETAAEHQFLQLQGGARRILQGDRTQAQKAIGVRGTKGRDGAVLQLRYFVGELGIGPVVVLGGRRAHQLDINSMASMSASRASMLVSFGSNSSNCAALICRECSPMAMASSAMRAAWPGAAHKSASTAGVN